MKTGFLLFAAAILAVVCDAKLAEKVSEDDDFVVYRIPVRALDLQSQATGQFEGYELAPSYGRSSSKSSSHSKSTSSSTGSGRGKGYGQGGSSHGTGHGHGGSSSGPGYGGGSSGQGYGGGSSGHGYGGGSSGHGSGYGSSGEGSGHGSSGHGSGYGGSGSGYGGSGSGYGGSAQGSGSGYGHHRAAAAEFAPGYRAGGAQPFNVNEFTRNLNHQFNTPAYRNNRFAPQASFLIPRAYGLRHAGFGIPTF